MADSPVRHIDDDASIYAAEIVPPEGNEYAAKYHVDLVRASVDEYGLGHEQRLTVGQHNSWMEAEEQLYELEDGLAENGLDAWGENAERLREQPFEEDIFYMAVTYPPDSGEEDANSGSKASRSRTYSYAIYSAASAPRQFCGSGFISKALFSAKSGTCQGASPSS